MNDGPQRTLAWGGSGQLVYNFTLKNNICLGVLAGLQFDTQGDTISQLMFTIGKRFWQKILTRAEGGSSVFLTFLWLEFH
jgi:hypothetical protein